MGVRVRPGRRRVRVRVRERKRRGEGGRKVKRGGLGPEMKL